MQLASEAHNDADDTAGILEELRIYTRDKLLHTVAHNLEVTHTHTHTRQLLQNNILVVTLTHHRTAATDIPRTHTCTHTHARAHTHTPAQHPHT